MGGTSGLHAVEQLPRHGELNRRLDVCRQAENAVEPGFLLDQSVLPLLYEVHGVVVNESFEAKPYFGKLLLQTEQDEMSVRRYRLWPLGKAPTDELRQSQ